MKVITKEHTIFIDVDDTLVMHEKEKTENGVYISVKDPIENRSIKLRVNEPMVRLLKEEHHRGSYIVVWSRGGWEWAQNVIVALGLGTKVDLVMSKPLAYFDDKPVEEWLKYRVYLSPDTPYKG
jgi:hypothetical protein